MSFIKTAIAAAALTLVAVSANAQIPAQKVHLIAAQTSAWDVASPMPFSREGSEHFTW